LFVRLLICRTDKGIDSGTNHLELFNRALELSNVVALSDTKPHTLPPGFTFFRVQQSQVKASNMRVDKFILLLQVSNPDALERTSARLSDDKRLVIISMADPDKFVHNHRKAIASQLARTLTWTSAAAEAAAMAPEIQVAETTFLQCLHRTPVLLIILLLKTATSTWPCGSCTVSSHQA
jgi:hypothetical protein